MPQHGAALPALRQAVRVKPVLQMPAGPIPASYTHDPGVRQLTADKLQSLKSPLTSKFFVVGLQVSLAIRQYGVGAGGEGGGDGGDGGNGGRGGRGEGLGGEGLSGGEGG